LSGQEKEWEKGIGKWNGPEGHTERVPYKFGKEPPRA